MDSKINLDLNLYKIILDNEAKKLTGKTMKRFELSKDLDAIKKEIKELQYEAFRDIYDSLVNGKVLFQIDSTKKE